MWLFFMFGKIYMLLGFFLSGLYDNWLVLGFLKYFLLGYFVGIWMGLSLKV